MKDRLAPCQFYICKGKCSKGREAEQKGLCQHCDKYRPRKGWKNTNDKRRKERYKYYD